MTGWTFEHVWNDLDYDLAIALHNWLPNHWYRQHASTARLGFAVERFLGVKHESFEEFLEVWMRPTGGAPKPRALPTFSPAAVADVDLAFDLGLLSQDALVALGPKRLRDSGAFARDRTTDTSVRGG